MGRELPETRQACSLGRLQCTTVLTTCYRLMLNLFSLCQMTMLASAQNGKTEYKSVTVADNATAEEFMDFYLDDSSRPTWVCSPHMHAPTLLLHVQQLVLMCRFIHRLHIALQLQAAHCTLAWRQLVVAVPACELSMLGHQCDQSSNLLLSLKSAAACRTP